ncbi:aminodeoxychorismate synthase, component I [Xenococcus sp. PCC 7305]|uniref:aminodeoxychorismate synthase component I n=1 Tax=Xenococcus sp. PCC 7305 TaxID=102125 RepID=UPI0002AB9A3C|nr:aminodeoxychorismate synthase component I [Xenococcus sp. PCC 7305]ELS04832.1 aminodeoxychorismate synthase, component I [Xenococcus sp. PCC 7305]
MNQIVIHDANRKQWLKFSQPSQVIQANCLAEVLSRWQLVNELVQKHKFYAVGFISYEAAAAFDSSLVTHHKIAFPLLWFGLYSRPEAIDLPEGAADFTLDWQSKISEGFYHRAIAKIKDYIAQGDSYQVNYTIKLLAEFAGSPWEYFLQLVKAQQADYAAYLDLEDWAICSASPELFFSCDRDLVTTRPMKGTVARGYSCDRDLALAQWLHTSEKNRAENVMIVDMIRNDLAKIAQLNSIKVTNLFQVEKYPTLWQMTSTVTAKTKAPITDIMSAMFPCASITGAPKSRTMEIIRELETQPRNIYTGTIGFITPNNQAQFNVAIRTVAINKKTNHAEYGVGGGIVWDSISHQEYQECQIKSQVLTRKYPSFDLLETILWTAHEGYFLLNYHLQRLENSASYFNFELDLPAIDKKLQLLANSLADKPHKVRLIVTKKGQIKCEAIPLSLSKLSLSQPVKLCLADAAIDIHNPFVYHKTTNRKVYNNTLKLYPDYDDVILWNERQEITETCIANIVVKINGQLLTPPVESGLLAGTFRAHLLADKKITEAVIRKQDLLQCENIYVINSVRKWQTVNLKKDEG